MKGAEIIFYILNWNGNPQASNCYLGDFMKKKIKDYDNYEIYDNGDVLNVSTQKILTGSIGENGYKYYRLSKEGQKKMFYAHRLVAEHFLENPENLPVVNHKDGDKLNNNVNNLEWVSYSDNVMHARKNNLISKVKEHREIYTEDLEGEQWRKIREFENYSVSSKGRVKNDLKNWILRPSITSGYKKVRLSKNGKVEDRLVHRLVYSEFNETDQFLPKGYVIDHIDGDKLNNDLSNLRYISLSENVLSALYDSNTNNSNKPVEQYDLQGNFIKSFPSVREAARQLNLDSSTISKVCRGKNKTHGGFIFKYSN